MIEIRQSGHGDSLLVLTNEVGRIVLEGDEVGKVIEFLVLDRDYRQWVDEAMKATAAV